MSDETVTVSKCLLQSLLDICVSSLDHGSGFLDGEESDSLVEAAQLLGVDPMTVVQSTDRCVYFARLNGTPFAHEWSDWKPYNYPGMPPGKAWRSCRRCGGHEEGRVP